MPARGIQHIDLAVRDVQRSVAFYSEILGPLGLKEKYRLATYRGTQDVIYLEYGVQGFGLRPVDGGEHRSLRRGNEHVAFEVDRPDEVEEAYRRCVSAGGEIIAARDYVKDGENYYAFFAFYRTVFGSRSSAGRAPRTTGACTLLHLKPEPGSGDGSRGDTLMRFRFLGGGLSVLGSGVWFGRHSCHGELPINERRAPNGLESKKRGD